jgi:nucleotide-binding universal stress UspA family protein
MKTILLATDYSKAANNALKYAIELAKFTKAKLVLFHAYNFPLPVSDMAMVMPAVIQDLEEENKKAIKKLEDKIVKQTHGKIEIESFVSSGMPVDEILQVVRKKKVDLVVIGIRGAGKLSQALIGSTATFLMKKTNVPVLVIPEKAKFSKARKIALAYDYSQPIKKDVLRNIKEFAKMFKAEVMILNVVSLFEEPGYKKALELVKLNKAFRGIKHKFYFPASENTPDEINSFVKKQKPGMLVMFPHKHTLLERLLYHTSDTKRMAFQTTIPLLSLHD